ncbi:MAG: acyltransferase [Alloalcanivorax venustensis]
MNEQTPQDPPPVRKRSLSRPRRALRALLATLDPRSWAHGLKLLNYYNYSHVIPRRSMSIGANAAISPNAIFSNPERIVIGRGLNLGARCHLWAGPSRGRIVIGDDVLFGPEVMVTAASYRFNDGQPVTAQAMDEADVIIGNDVWIATRVTILPGTVIGDGAVIGAGAVVRGEIPPFAIAVGTPARVVGHRQITQDAAASDA